jgi:hypothetical protein
MLRRPVNNINPVSTHLLCHNLWAVKVWFDRRMYKPGIVGIPPTGGVISRTAAYGRQIIPERDIKRTLRP